MDIVTISSPIRTRQIGSWEVNECLGTALSFSAELIEQALTWIDRWVQHYPWEPSFAWEHYGVPSVIVRLDCTVRASGSLFIYEIEDRPSGVGQTAELNPDFRQRLLALMETWPPFVLVAPTTRRENDDARWPGTSRLTFDEVEETAGCVILREDPDEAFPMTLVARSLSTVLFEGSKSYGTKLGWWRQVDEYAVRALIDQGESAFVLKPNDGMHFHDGERWRKAIVIYHRGSRRHRPPGSSSASQVQRRFEYLDTMYLQRYVAPQQLVVDQDVDHWLGGKALHWIYRIYFGFNPATHHWVPLGGFWEARPEVIVNGASNSVSGPAPLGT